MKKLLALLLLSPLMSGEEVEYPIELTCELGSEIIFLNFTNDSSDDWIKYHKTFWKGHPKSGTKKELDSVKITRDGIEFVGHFRMSVYTYFINRFTLKFTRVPFSSNGQCFKGFKEYTEKQI